MAAPSIDEFWIVIRLLETKAGKDPDESLEAFSTRLSLKPLHVRKAIDRVEAYVESNLFYPGGHWSPTTSGLRFLEQGLRHLNALDMLAVELSADAVWARDPNRREYEERIGYFGAPSIGLPTSKQPDEEH